MQRNEHLTEAGLRRIVAIKASMNRRQLSDKLIEEFPDVVPVLRPTVSNQKIQDPH